MSYAKLTMRLSNARFIILFMLNKIYNWLYKTVYEHLLAGRPQNMRRTGAPPLVWMRIFV